MNPKLGELVRITELYIVNTNIVPRFLDPEICAITPTMAREAFEEYKRRSTGIIPKPCPYVALFKNHRFWGNAVVVPHAFGQSKSSIKGDKIRDKPFKEGLIAILSGARSGIGPIETVVEFSLDPLYHDYLDQLKDSYEIRKVQLEI